MIKKLAFILLTLVASHSGLAQIDTLDKVFKPRIGVGTGTLTYFGEVQNYQIGFTPTVNRIAGSLYINAPLSRYFNLEFSTIYGKVVANERTLARNLNFQSRIRTGSVMLYYNFYPILSGYNGSFTPLLGVGFTSFEFLSKTDMYDANGMMYHYWSDGSIMSLPESDPNASTAIPLTRDYTYETDLREQNLDSLGKYKEQAFAIPISFGGEWHIAKRFDFRLAATINYSFTDLIDNISPAGTGVRKGDTKKDYFMYTSASLSYDLEFNRDGGRDGFEEDGPLELAEFEQIDTDQDGVIDALDQCIRTPLEAIVDENGCPLDSDNDGAADYYDEEPGTPEGNYVDAYGVTISEEEWLKQMELFNDSTGLLHDFDEQYTKVDWRNKDGQVVNTKGVQKDQMIPKNYVIIIGKEHKSVTSNQLSEYLGWNDFKTITRGDTVYYILGEYEKIEDAVAAKSGLENEGVEVEIIGRSTHDNKKYIEVDSAVVSKVEKINIKNGKEQPDFSQPEQVFRVQLGAFKNKIDTEKLFPDIEDVNYATGKDGITRYYTHSFKTYEEAEAERKRLAGLGYDKAFVTAYQDKDRVTLKEAGVTLPTNYSEEKDKETFEKDPNDNNTANNQNNNNSDTTSTNNNQNENNNSSINMSEVKYRVLLGNFKGEVPVAVIDIFIQIGGVRPVKNEDGSTTYYSRVVNSKGEAEKMLEDYKTYDLQGLELIYEYDGKYYTQSEFNDLNK
ncbi:MAG: SPOR domain-containing protein [Putridiphycobacter sp.]